VIEGVVCEAGVCLFDVVTDLDMLRGPKLPCDKELRKQTSLFRNRQHVLDIQKEEEVSTVAGRCCCTDPSAHILYPDILARRTKKVRHLVEISLFTKSLRSCFPPFLKIMPCFASLRT
jgi:hypothetical protein